MGIKRLIIRLMKRWNLNISKTRPPTTPDPWFTPSSEYLIKPKWNTNNSRNPMTITHHDLSSMILPWCTPSSTYVIKHMKYQQSKNPMTIAHNILSFALLPWFTPFSEYVIKPMKYHHFQKKHDHSTPCFIISSLAMPRSASKVPQRSQICPQRFPQASPSASQELPQPLKP